MCLCGGVSVCLRGSLGGFLRRHISPKPRTSAADLGRCIQGAVQPLSSIALLGDQEPETLLLLAQAVSVVSSSLPLLRHCKSALSPQDSHPFAQPVLLPLRSSVTVSQSGGVGIPTLQTNLLELRNITSLSFNTDGKMESGFEASPLLCWTLSYFITIGNT